MDSVHTHTVCSHSLSSTNTHFSVCVRGHRDTNKPPNSVRHVLIAEHCRLLTHYVGEMNAGISLSLPLSLYFNVVHQFGHNLCIESKPCLQKCNDESLN